MNRANLFKLIRSKIEETPVGDRVVYLSPSVAQDLADAIIGVLEDRRLLVMDNDDGSIIDDTWSKIVLYDPIHKDFFRHESHGGPVKEVVWADMASGMDSNLRLMHKEALRCYSNTNHFLPHRLILNVKPFSDAGANVLKMAELQYKREVLRKLSKEDRQLLGLPEPEAVAY